MWHFPYFTPKPEYLPSLPTMKQHKHQESVLQDTWYLWVECHRQDVSGPQVTFKAWPKSFIKLVTTEYGKKWIKVILNISLKTNNPKNKPKTKAIHNEHKSKKKYQHTPFKPEAWWCLFLAQKSALYIYYNFWGVPCDRE